MSYVHASLVDGDGVKCTTILETNTMEQKSGESSSKSGHKTKGGRIYGEMHR